MSEKFEWQPKRLKESSWQKSNGFWNNHIQHAYSNQSAVYRLVKTRERQKSQFAAWKTLVFTSHSTMAILSSSSAMNISFCATFSLKVSTCRIVGLFVCFIIKTIMVSWCLVLVHFVYMDHSLLTGETVCVNPHLLYHGLDLPLLREHHVVEVLYSLSQFCCFPFQLLGPDREHMAYERYNICNKILK